MLAVRLPIAISQKKKPATTKKILSTTYPMGDVKYWEMSLRAIAQILEKFIAGCPSLSVSRKLLPSSTPWASIGTKPTCS